MLASKAAALPALVGVSMPTMTWRNCTLPLSTQGRASAQNLLQYGQFGSVNTYTVRGASALPSAIQWLRSSCCHSPAVIGACTAFASGASVTSWPWASSMLPTITWLPSGVA